jgi:hypothetical protein
MLPPIDRCLAYVVAANYSDWLGLPTPSGLQALLIGAEDRAAFTKARVPGWQITGPLNDPSFYLPLVARTGHPSLRIRWATALELLYHSLDDAMTELRSLLEAWARDFAFPTEVFASIAPPAESLQAHLIHVAHRPGMYLGRKSAWLLKCYLVGLDRGGDWLALPPLPGLSAVVQSIEERSRVNYGSTFGAYRVYESDPAALLSWAGIAAE